MKSQILGFDVLKIILALFVVAIHCWVKDSNYYLYQLCQIAVPCFFVISGFLLEKQSEGNEYNKKYLKKIIRLYSIWVLIYFPFSLYQLFSSGKPFSESIYWYIRNIFISGDFYQGWQLWYLLALIQVSIVLMILKKSFPGGACLGDVGSLSDSHWYFILLSRQSFRKKLYEFSGKTLSER